MFGSKVYFGMSAQARRRRLPVERADHQVEKADHQFERGPLHDCILFSGGDEHCTHGPAGPEIRDLGPDTPDPAPFPISKILKEGPNSGHVAKEISRDDVKPEPLLPSDEGPGRSELRDKQGWRSLRPARANVVVFPARPFPDQNFGVCPPTGGDMLRPSEWSVQYSNGECIIPSVLLLSAPRAALPFPDNLPLELRKLDEKVQKMWYS